MSITTKSSSTAMVLEILPGLFGLLGIGWLYIGNKKTGAGFLIGMMVWNLIALLLISRTDGMACFGVVPLNIILIVISALSLSDHMKAHAYLSAPSVSVESKQTDESAARIVDIVAKAAVSQSDLPAFQNEIKGIASSSSINDQSMQALLVAGWERAVSSALDDDLLDETEESALGAFRDHFSLTADDLDKNGAYTKLVRALVLREVVEGKNPQRVKVEGTMPFNFKKGETLIWLFPNVPYYEPRTRTTYSGGSSGTKLKVAKGLYFRIGGFAGHPVATTQTVHMDTGTFAVTDANIYFAGSVKSFRIPYNKIMAFTPHSDGIGIQRDASTAKPQIFVTGDGWFTYNLITNLANR